jgi:hypothetical protein
MHWPERWLRWPRSSRNLLGTPMPPRSAAKLVVQFHVLLGTKRAKRAALKIVGRESGGLGTMHKFIVLQLRSSLGRPRFHLLYKAQFAPPFGLSMDQRAREDQRQEDCRRNTSVKLGPYLMRPPAGTSVSI